MTQTRHERPGFEVSYHDQKDDSVLNWFGYWTSSNVLYPAERDALRQVTRWRTVTVDGLRGPLRLRVAPRGGVLHIRGWMRDNRLITPLLRILLAAAAKKAGE